VNSRFTHDHRVFQRSLPRLGQFSQPKSSAEPSLEWQLEMLKSIYKSSGTDKMPSAASHVLPRREPASLQELTHSAQENKNRTR
jgi:hypothetical protein